MGKSNRFRCTRCTAEIEPNRAEAALSRGRMPRYCSPRCKNANQAAEHRQRQRAGALPVESAELQAAPIAELAPDVNDFANRLAAAFREALDP